MLQGKKIVERAKKIIKENPEYFEALVEFERTKKLPKLKYKKRVNFTIDADLVRKFRNYCREKGYNMSAKIEKYINEELNNS